MRCGAGSEGLSSTTAAPGTIPSFTSITVPMMVPVCGAGAETCPTVAPVADTLRMRIRRRRENLALIISRPLEHRTMERKLRVQKKYHGWRQRGDLDRQKYGTDLC